MRRYLESRLPLADKHLEEPVRELFLEFCQLWEQRRRAWQAGEETGSNGHQRQLYLRFVGQCRSWEATLRLAMNTTLALGPARERTTRSRVRRLAERESRRRSFYQWLEQTAQQRRAALSLPWRVREAYAVLELPVGSDPAEVRSAYRRLAHAHHPDRDGDALEMARLSSAYRIIMQFRRLAEPQA